jgi:hypothetical protein
VIRSYSLLLLLTLGCARSAAESELSTIDCYTLNYAPTTPARTIVSLPAAFALLPGTTGPGVLTASHPADSGGAWEQYGRNGSWGRDNVGATTIRFTREGEPMSRDVVTIRLSGPGATLTGIARYTVPFHTPESTKVSATPARCVRGAGLSGLLLMAEDIPS